MHLRPDGRPATGDLSANAWQSRQGMPYLPAWIVWSNGTSPAVPAPAGVAAGAGACVCGWALDTTTPPTIAAAAKATRDLVWARVTMTSKSERDGRGRSAASHVDGELLVLLRLLELLREDPEDVVSVGEVGDLEITCLVGGRVI